MSNYTNYNSYNSNYCKYCKKIVDNYNNNNHNENCASKLNTSLRKSEVEEYSPYCTFKSQKSGGNDDLNNEAIMTFGGKRPIDDPQEPQKSLQSYKTEQPKTFPKSFSPSRYDSLNKEISTNIDQFRSNTGMGKFLGYERISNSPTSKNIKTMERTEMESSFSKANSSLINSSSKDNKEYKDYKDNKDYKDYNKEYSLYKKDKNRNYNSEK